MEVKNAPFIAIFGVLYLPALPTIVLGYCFVFVYVFHVIAFDLYLIC